MCVWRNQPETEIRKTTWLVHKQQRTTTDGTKRHWGCAKKVIPIEYKSKTDAEYWKWNLFSIRIHVRKTDRVCNCTSMSPVLNWNWIPSTVGQLIVAATRDDINNTDAVPRGRDERQWAADLCMSLGCPSIHPSSSVHVSVEVVNIAAVPSLDVFAVAGVGKFAEIPNRRHTFHGRLRNDDALVSVLFSHHPRPREQFGWLGSQSGKGRHGTSK